MGTVVYDGVEYHKVRDKWVDANCVMAPKGIQNELDFLQLKQMNLDDYNVYQLMKLGDEFKNGSSIGFAIKCYNKALEKSDKYETSRILPRLTSCLRKQGKADEAVKVYSQMKAKWGADLFGYVALTSIAAAYCDLGEYEDAKKCCNKAYALEDGHCSGELASVFGRIRKENNDIGLDFDFDED